MKLSYPVESGVLSQMVLVPSLYDKAFLRYWQKRGRAVTSCGHLAMSSRPAYVIVARSESRSTILVNNFKER